MQKIFYILFFPVVSFLISNIDIIFGWNYELIGDRSNYLKHVENPFNAYNSLFSFFNYEFLWFRVLQFIKSITSSNSPNFVLRIVAFISSFIFLNAFKRRTNSYLLPLFIIFMPGVFELFVVKLRHGLALSIFAYLSSFRSIKFKNFYYLLLCMIHSSFLVTIPIYLFGLSLKKLELLKIQKFLLNFSFLFAGGIFSFFILQLMKIVGVRQYGYISSAVENVDFSSFGLYRISILLIILSLMIIKIKSYDSEAIIYSTSFFLGVSFLSFIGGRFLTTFLPFAISELFLSKSKINKIIYWFIRFLIISVFIYGWIIKVNTNWPYS